MLFTFSPILCKTRHGPCFTVVILRDRMYVKADHVLLSEPIFSLSFRGKAGGGPGGARVGQEWNSACASCWPESTHQHAFGVVQELPSDRHPGPHLVFSPLIRSCSRHLQRWRCAGLMVAVLMPHHLDLLLRAWQGSWVSPSC